MPAHIDITPATDSELLARGLGKVHRTVIYGQTHGNGTAFYSDGKGGGIIIGPGAGGSGIVYQDPAGNLKPVVDTGPIQDEIAKAQKELDAHEKAMEQAQKALTQAQADLAAHAKELAAEQAALQKAQQTADKAVSDAASAAATGDTALKNANSALANADHVTVNASAPSSPHDGDIWYPIDKNSHVTGMKTWDAAKKQWVDVTLMAGRILVPGSVDDTVIADGAVTTGKIKAGAITGDKVAAKTLDAGKVLADHTVTGDLVASGTITGNNIAAKSLDAGKVISDHTVTGDLVATHTITGDNIQANSIKSGNLAANAIDGMTITGGKIQSTNGRLVIGDGGILGKDANGNATFYYDSNTGTVQLAPSAVIGSSTAQDINNATKDAQKQAQQAYQAVINSGGNVDKAKKAAEDAYRKAVDAANAASNAQNTANSAQNTAIDANNKANIAADDAGQAQNDVNQIKPYIREDSDGVHVGTEGGEEALVAPGAFEIRNSSGIETTSLRQNIIGVPTYVDGMDWGESQIIFGQGGIAINAVNPNQPSYDSDPHPYYLRIGAGGIGIRVRYTSPSGQVWTYKLNIGSGGIAMGKYKTDFDYSKGAYVDTPQAALEVGSNGPNLTWNRGKNHFYFH